MISLTYYLVLSGILFSIGVFGFLLKRNIITIFMCVELMLNAVNLTFVAFARFYGDLAGQVNSCKRSGGLGVGRSGIRLFCNGCRCR